MRSLASFQRASLPAFSLQETSGLQDSQFSSALPGIMISLTSPTWKCIHSGGMPPGFCQVAQMTFATKRKINFLLFHPANNIILYYSFVIINPLIIRDCGTHSGFCSPATNWPVLLQSQILAFTFLICGKLSPSPLP